MANTMTMAQSQQLSVFENKVLLKHSQIHSFRYCLRLLSHYSGRVEGLPWKPHDLQTPNIYYLALSSQSMITPGLRLSGEREGG